MTAPRHQPLAHLALAAARETSDPDAGVTLRALPFQASNILRGDSGDAAFRAAFHADLGFDLPVAPNHVSGQSGVTAVWLGPSEWLILGHMDPVALAGQRHAVIGNGDVKSVYDAKKLLTLSQADGVMIGRGTYGRPWFLQQVIHFLATGEELPDPSLVDQFTTVQSHYEDLLSHYGSLRGLRMARKHVGWYSKGLPGSAEFRGKINEIDEPVEAKKVIADFYHTNLDRQAA